MKILLVYLIIFNLYAQKENEVLIKNFIKGISNLNKKNKLSDCHYSLESNTPEREDFSEEDEESTNSSVVKQKNRNLVNACVRRTEETGIIKTKVEYKSEHLCNENKTFRDNVSYELEVENNQLKINLNILVKFGKLRSNQKSEKQILYSKLNSVKSCIEKIYSSQGLVLNLSLSTDSESLENINHEVNLYRYYPSANSSNWPLFKDEQGTMRDSEVCTMVAHELGHTLGLADTYYDSRCPKRKNSRNPNALMNHLVYHAQAVFENKEVMQIIEPLCGK